MKKLITTAALTLVMLLTALPMSAMSTGNNQDAPVWKIDNTSSVSPSYLRAGFVINDDHPLFEFKLETTYGANSGYITVRNSNGDNNENVSSVDFASQFELDNQLLYVESLVGSVSRTANLTLDLYLEQNVRVEQNEQDILVNKALIDLNATLAAGNRVDIGTNKGDIATNREGISDNRTDINTNTATGAQNKSAIASNLRSINTNTQSINTLFGHVSRLDTRLDGLIASSHAIANARPYLSGKGQTAIGMGIGVARGAKALSIGVAHSFTERLSASFTVSATNGTNRETSGGAGVQYNF